MKNKPLKRLTATLTAASVVIAGGLVPITAGAATTTKTLDLGTAASQGPTSGTSGTFINVGAKSGSYYPVSARIPGSSPKAYKTYDISQYTDGATKVEVSFDVKIDPLGRLMFSVADADLIDTGAFSTTSNMGLPAENGVWSAIGKYDNDGAIVLDGTGEANISSIHNTDATVTIEIDLQTRTQNIKVVSGGSTVTERKNSLPLDASADSVDTFMITAGTTTGPDKNTSTQNPVMISDVTVKSEFTSESGTSTTLTNNIDFGFGDWSYSGGLSGMTANKDAAVFYSNIPLKDELDYGPKSINIPVKSLPGDGSVVYLYSGQKVSSYISSNMLDHEQVTVGDKSVSTFGAEYITDKDRGLGNTKDSGYLAKLTFSTKDKKKYVNITTADGNQGDLEIAADGVIEVPIDTENAAAMFDGTLLMWVVGADKVEPGAYGELSLVYRTKESKEFDVDADVQSAAGTRYYFGRVNAADLSKVTVTAAAAGDETTVDIYAVDTKVADFGSGTSFDAASKIGTGKIAAGSATGIISVSKAPGDNKYIYAVVSAADKKTPVTISDVSFGYKSKEVEKAAVRTQYLLQNTSIDTSKVMSNDAFNTNYYNQIKGVVDEISILTEGSTAALAVTTDKCKAEYFELTESLKGWEVVKSIEENLGRVYDAVSGLEEDKKYDEASKSRDAIEAVQKEYEALTSTTAQKFVGAVNYSKLSTLNDIIVNHDSETIKKYNDAIALVWDTEKDASKITQDNYLVYSAHIEDLNEFAGSYASLPESVKAQMTPYDGTKLAEMYETIMKDVNETFISKTAADFVTMFNEVKAVYTAADASYDEKYAAVFADGISGLYESINASEYKDDVKSKADETEESYTTYESWRSAFDKYALAEDFIAASNALKAEIDKTGISADSYENIADLYYTAMDKYKAAEAVTDSDFDNIAPEELKTNYAAASEYIGLAEELMAETAESVTKTARDAINAVRSEAENTSDWVSSVKIARYRYDALKTNAKKYVDNADMNGEAAYGEILAGYEETMAGYEEENIAAMQSLYDEKAQDCLDYAASLTYNSESTDIDEYTNNFYNAAKAYDDVNKKINGNVSLNKEGAPVVNDGAKSDIFTNIENTYNILLNYKKAIDAFSAKGTAYANAIQAEIELIYSGQDATYETINEYTEDAIKETLDTLYPETIDYYDTSLVEYDDKGAVSSDSNSEAAQNTKEIRDAASQAKKEYDNAKAEFEKQYTNATGKTGGFDPAGEYEEPWVNETVESAYTKLDTLIESKLKTEFDNDMAIEAAKEEVEAAAQAEVDRLTGLIGELYNKLSTTPYADEASIDADREAYDSLVNAVNTAKQNMNFIYQDEESGTINYFTQLYPSSADSMLAFIDSSLDQWKSAWGIVESANALDISLVYNDTENLWYVNDETEFNALKDQYDASIDVIKENVNSVISSFFTDKEIQISYMNDAVQNYANAVNNIPGITSTTLYESNHGAVEAVNAYVKGLNDTVASEDADESAKTAAQAKLDIIAANFGTETAKLSTANTMCEIIKPAYDFDAKVKEANDIYTAEPTDTAKLKAALDEAAAMYADITANHADSVKYVQQYVLYTKLMNDYPAEGYDTFAQNVNDLADVVYSSSAETMKAFLNSYNELTETYGGFTVEQQNAFANSKEMLDAKKAQYDTVAAAQAEAAVINTENTDIYTQYNGNVTVENYAAAKAAYDGAKAKMDALDAKYPNLGTEEVPVLASTAVTMTLSQLAADIEKAGPVVDTVGLINAIGTVSETSGPAIKAARDSYNALGKDQQLLVSNYAVLVEAEKAYAAFDSVQEAIEAAEAVNALIAAVPAAEDITDENVEDAKAKAEAAREAFDALNDTAKLYVTGEDKLAAAEEKIAELTRPSQDVDGDSIVNTKDFNMVLQKILGRGDDYTDAQSSACDVNKDGSVNVFDLIEIVSNWD